MLLESDYSDKSNKKYSEKSNNKLLLDTDYRTPKSPQEPPGGSRGPQEPDAAVCGSALRPTFP